MGIHLNWNHEIKGAKHSNILETLRHYTWIQAKRGVSLLFRNLERNRGSTRPPIPPGVAGIRMGQLRFVRLYTLAFWFWGAWQALLTFDIILLKEKLCVLRFLCFFV